MNYYGEILENTELVTWNKVSELIAAFSNSPAFTGTPTAPTAANETDTTQIATTAFVHSLLSAALEAFKVSPAFTGIPTAPTAALGTNTTQIATTAFVNTSIEAAKESPVFTGTPTAPTAASTVNSNQIATTAYVQNNLLYIPVVPITDNELDRLWGEA